MYRSLTLWFGALASLAAFEARADQVDGLIETIRQVGPEGKGNRAATAAWAELSRQPASSLTRILGGLDGANRLAANWIHGAVDAIAERELADGGRLPNRDLESFLLDTQHDPRGRRLAFEWLARVDDSARDRLIPGMLSDSSTELRREAVQRLIDEADSHMAPAPAPAAPATGTEKADSDGDKKAEPAKLPPADPKVRQQVLALYRRAMDAARDEDQVKRLAARLKELGEKVDLPAHYGFITNWKLIGPFDNGGGKGFNIAYPPEMSIDLGSKVAGKDGEVGWVDHATVDDYGIVDLNQAVGKHKGAIIYALAEVESDADRPVEIRLGVINAWKLWVNGSPLFAHEEYHSGMRLDQHRVHATLRAGKNTILVKVCQNEQTESWAQDWKFQLRVCDQTGTAILTKGKSLPAKGSQSATNPPKRSDNG